MAGARIGSSSPSTKPGSRADRILAITASLANELGRGAEIAEIRSAYEEQAGHPAPKSFTSEVSSLKRRGLLEMVGGRAGRSLYAPSGSGVRGEQNEEDDALQVLRAVRFGYRRLGRALSTREVAEELQRLDAQLSTDHPNAVRKYLETLSRARRRGPRAFRDPKVIRVPSEAVTGRPSAHWAPAGAHHPERIRTAPRSAAEAVRAAVGSAALDLGRPLSATEIRWWLQVPWAEAVHHGKLHPRSVGTAVADTARIDAEYEGEAGRVHVVQTGWTCHGGAPQRYSVGPPSPLEQHLCEFEDIIHLLRPADELRGIRGLRVRSGSARSNVLRLLAEVRDNLVRGRVADWASDIDRAEVVEGAARVQRELARWQAASRGLDGRTA